MLSVSSAQSKNLTGQNKGFTGGYNQRNQQRRFSFNSFSRRQQLLFFGGSLGVATITIQGANAESVGCESLISTSSGIQYCELVEGTGNSPVKGSVIRAHYEGKLESGKVFDSSYSRGRPLTFTVGVGQVIKGWDMGILGDDDLPPMKAGGKRRLLIPSGLAYGERGAGGGLIPPNAALIFDVEYLGKQGERR
eukprot:TRINITY_DN4089_c1_g6_i1.p1 TRINITY_DN4089_c1_g6~~TRINITY_DN4089_c1_g6_i1.p1  ORF type:complete len:193 (-),score=25.63 TRINITY_DN4089_c1_g6_i1:383-961(-)